MKNRGNVVKIGETLDKIGKPGNFEEVHFFPVSAPKTVNQLISPISTKGQIGNVRGA